LQLLHNLERNPLKKHLLSAAVAAAALLAVSAPALAGAETPATGVTDTVSIVDVKGALKFAGPATVHQGDALKVINETDPKKVGPHTFSLVTPGSVPKTPGARKNCFTPKHICMSIAKWHGFNPKTEKISINPVKAGPEGWSTAGDNSKTGDSWFTGEAKTGTSLTQQVSAEPGTYYYICAIHPWMHGKVTVLAPGS
jgi:plastocyanin